MIQLRTRETSACEYFASLLLCAFALKICRPVDVDCVASEINRVPHALARGNRGDVSPICSGETLIAAIGTPFAFQWCTQNQNLEITPANSANYEKRKIKKLISASFFESRLRCYD